MKVFNLFLIAALFSSTAAFALGGGNGSSGIGNLEVDPAYNLHAKYSSGQPVARVGNVIVDPSSGEKLLQVDRVHTSQLKSLYGDQLVNATLGAAHGYEVQPTRAEGEAGAQNIWIICQPGQSECVRLSPLSRTNPKVPAVVGALFHPDSKKDPK